MTQIKNPPGAGIAFIFITVVLDMIGIGLIIPVLPDIMKRFTSSPDLASEYFGYFISIYALMQFFVSPLLGAISDFLGRRSILLVSLIIAAGDYLMMAFAPTLGWLFVGRVIAGLTGANITVAMAYVADVSDDSSRAKNFGLIGAAFGFGFIIGPVLGGLVGQWGPQYPFIVAAFLNALNFLFGFFILPESLKPENRQAFQWQKINPFHSLQKVLKQSYLAPLLVMVFFMQMAGQTHPSIWTLYTGTRFQWTTKEVGISLAIVGLFSVISQGFLTGKVVAWLGEMKTVFWGLLGAGISYACFGFATQGWMMYAILVLSSVFWVAPPTLQSLITKQVPQDGQGELQGSMVALTSLASILNPLIVTQLFAKFGMHSDSAVHIPGMPYYFAGLMGLCSWLIFWRFQKRLR